MVLDARRISPTTATNALTIKDTPERIAAAARVLSAIDKARPEVIIDVELLEVDRTKLQEYGLQIASPSITGADRHRTASVSVAERCRRHDDAADAAQPDAVRHPLRRPAGALLPPAEDRHQHAHAGQPAAAHHRRHRRRRRASASGCRCRSRPSRRSPPAARRSSRSRRSTTRTSASTSTSRRARITTTTCR